MNAAVFLQKTYDLIQSTPTDVAEWSNHGRAFVIKKIKDFERTMLPKYFKHSNFASFSRQLRFYGFDKSKKHDIRIVQDASKDEASCQGWWEFANPHFLRDDPAQMANIRRKTYSEPAAAAAASSDASSEVVTLKRKMSSLQTQLSDLTNQISALTSVVQAYCQADSDDDDHVVSIMPTKKAKTLVSSPVSIAASDFLDFSAADAAAVFASDDEIDEGILDALLDFATPAFAAATPFELVGFEL
ncbi:Aste57867_593 [Aphanomyces stellatus]|uniref:Aste57867_593 protein n=1 Tax=Aphanomyces stellatus TaxID=120398 RepID=A0A485K369_9STRA|nr:hypothetical protein As57867_000592 [Aphanomyces stellatus]VFT77818.1 Aste57867_593 [Aphanomyces stellatus]